MERGVEHLVEWLPRERFRLTVLSPFESSFTDRLRALGADVVVASITNDPSWRSIQLTCALVTSGAVDIIHSHLPNAHVLGGLVGRLTDRPVLATVHGREITSIDLEVHHAAATHLAVVCRHSELHALGIGARSERLHRIPSGVDTALFAPWRESGPGPRQLREEYGIPASAPLVGFVGRLSWEKGPDLFLRMAATLCVARPDAHFMIIGEGPMHAALAASIKRLELTNIAHLAGTRMDMPAAYAEFDVAVSTSRIEGMPFAIMEAMASGVPIVARKVGGVADLVQHGTSGCLVDESEEDAIAGQVAALLNDAMLRNAMGRAARERAVAHFALAETVEQTTQLYATLINGDKTIQSGLTTRTLPVMKADSSLTR